jgi:Tol biopolymer transport system component
MKSKFLLFVALMLLMTTNACSPITAINDSGAQPARTFQVAFIGSDGNVWFTSGLGLEPRQITTDAFHSEGNDSPGAGIAYYFPRISGDGEWVAYRRDVTETGEAGLQYTSGLFLHNSKTGKSLPVLDEMPAGFAWKPGTHLLAYGLAVPEGYFGRSEDPIQESLARGLMMFDADTGKTQDLVHPERGYAIYNPQWSPDGQLLGFDELSYMEGRGKFAYYDFEKATYIPWDEPIGNYVFRKDSSEVIYDHLSYVAQGTEDIFTKPLQGGNEQRLVHYPSATEYAFSPALSPSGDRIAYLASLDGPDSQTYRLFVRILDNGEPMFLGKFDAVLNLGWSHDGSWLVFSAGPWDSQKVIAVNVSDGSSTELGEGTLPDISR